MKGFLASGIVGAVLVYFLEPKRGSKRRSTVMTKVGGKAGGSVTEKAQSVTSTVSGAAKSVTSTATKTAQSAKSKVTGTVAHTPDNPNPDDTTLRDRVETEIFRDPETSREHINLDVVNGVVTVRGELPNQANIDDLVAKIKAIANVRSVENLLHLPGTPAPNKVDSLRA